MADPLDQVLTVAEDLRTSVSDTVDSVLSQGAAQVKRVGPKMPAAPELPGGSSSSPELPEKFPELPEIGELPELPSLPEAPKAGGSPKAESTPSPSPSPEEGVEERKVEEPLH